MNRHNYEDEIIEILGIHQGRIEGFNNLRKLGRGKGFHPNYLKMNLDRMAMEQTIKIEQEGNKQVFLLNKFNFDQAFQEFTKELDKMESKLFKPTLKRESKMIDTREYILEIFHHHNKILTSWLYAECVEKNTRQTKKLEAAKKYLYRKMKTAMLRLDEHERSDIINSLPYL